MGAIANGQLVDGVDANDRAASAPFGGALGHARRLTHEHGAVVLNHPHAVGIARAWRHTAVQQGGVTAVRFAPVQATGIVEFSDKRIRGSRLFLPALAIDFNVLVVLPFMSPS